jgi:hypothetical protein
MFISQGLVSFLRFLLDGGCLTTLDLHLSLLSLLEPLCGAWVIANSRLLGLILRLLQCRFQIRLGRPFAGRRSLGVSFLLLTGD